MQATQQIKVGGKIFLKSLKNGVINTAKAKNEITTPIYIQQETLLGTKNGEIIIINTEGIMLTTATQDIASESIPSPY